MAANTPITFTLNARDWEVVLGIIDNSAENDIRALKAALQNYYSANANPKGATPVPVTTREKTLVKIFNFFYGNTIRNLNNDIGGSAFSRVIAAIRAANNIADNYISTQLATEDTDRVQAQTSIRKYGREVLMMEGFDSL